MAWGLFIKFILPYISEILLGKDEEGNPTMLSRVIIIFFIALCCYLFYSFYNFIDEDYTEVYDKINILEKEHVVDESLLKDRATLIVELNNSLRVLAAEIALQRARVNELQYSLSECRELSKRSPPPLTNSVILPPPEDTSSPNGVINGELKGDVETELQHSRQDAINNVDRIIQDVTVPSL